MRKNYMVVFVCYLTTSDLQRQHAFVSKIGKLRITDDMACSGEKIHKHLRKPLIDVEFFSSKKEAIKRAEIYCHPQHIHIME